jgi:hypothetical protein
MPGLAVPFALFTALYVLLSIVTAIILGRQMLVASRVSRGARGVPVAAPVAGD